MSKKPFGLFSEKKFRGPRNIFSQFRKMGESVRAQSRAEVNALGSDTFEGDVRNWVIRSGGKILAGDNGDGTATMLANVQLINWWLPLTLADDDVTIIYCQALATISGVKYLYVGGDFARIGGVTASNIARYNFETRQWEAIGSGLNDTVLAVAVDVSGNLYAGGEFLNAGGDANADYIAKWNGSAWSALGSGLNSVRAIAFDGSDNLYAGGNFIDADGIAEADRIAYFDGQSWNALTNGGGLSGLGGNVYSVVLDSDTNTVYAAGDFDTAGTIKTASIAAFVRPLADALDIVAGLFEQYQARGDAKYILATLLGAVSGVATLDSSSRVVEAIQRIFAGTSALTATEGYTAWQSTTKRLLLYDAQRERSLSSIGWTPSALPLIYDPSAALTTAYSLAANGGTLVIPMLVTGHMLLQGVTVRNTDTGTARSWRWHLYEQYLNNGNSGENTLTRIESGNGNDSFTPAGAASNRTLNGTGAPTYLAPGVYWLAIQNVHATNTFGLASTAVGSSAFAPNSAQVKTLTVPLGSTLDLVAATWTKLVDIYAVRMNGRVFGQTTAF